MNLAAVMEASTTSSEPNPEMDNNPLSRVFHLLARNEEKTRSENPTDAITGQGSMRITRVLQHNHYISLIMLMFVTGVRVLSQEED
jgi:hypothetical protein